MADMMMFPDTWEEFEESYGFTDKEQIYTNGSRLIPSFRVKQWLEHLESKQRQADTPQTDLLVKTPRKSRESHEIDTPQTESTGSPIGDYRDGVGAWQTDCDDRYAIRTDSGEVVAYACPLGCEQTDCGWGEPNE